MTRMTNIFLDGEDLEYLSDEELIGCSPYRQSDYYNNEYYY